jgi:hypothetical protein
VSTHNCYVSGCSQFASSSTDHQRREGPLQRRRRKLRSKRKTALRKIM